MISFTEAQKHSIDHGFLTPVVNDPFYNKKCIKWSLALI